MSFVVTRDRGEKREGAFSSQYPRRTEHIGWSDSSWKWWPTKWRAFQASLGSREFTALAIRDKKNLLLKSFCILNKKIYFVYSCAVGSPGLLRRGEGEKRSSDRERGVQEKKFGSTHERESLTSQHQRSSVNARFRFVLRRRYRESMRKSLCIVPR